MLTANDISTALQRVLGEGRALAVVSLLEVRGQIAPQPTRLLVDESGALNGGTLGAEGLDRLAARHAAALLADEQQEIVTARLSELPATLANDAAAADLSERFGDAQLLFEIARPALELIICGGGHVGQAVAKAGRLLDFQVTVIDDRAEFAARDKFPDPQVRLIADDFIRALDSLKLTPASHLVIVTRGHKHDEMCLQAVIDRPARYVGMIGSRRRTTTIREHLRRTGVPAELLRRVHAPIGLDIGAQTPEEIALAILAEIVLVRRSGTGEPKSAAGPMSKAR